MRMVGTFAATPAALLAWSLRRVAPIEPNPRCKPRYGDASRSIGERFISLGERFRREAENMFKHELWRDLVDFCEGNR
jgi:hypothetical protein